MDTKTVAYRGHLKRLSDPRDATKVVEAGEEIEVPATMVLSPLWEEVATGTKKNEASTEDGDSR